MKRKNHLFLIEKFFVGFSFQFFLFFRGAVAMQIWDQWLVYDHPEILNEADNWPRLFGVGSYFPFDKAGFENEWGTRAAQCARIK